MKFRIGVGRSVAKYPFSKYLLTSQDTRPAKYTALFTEERCSLTGQKQGKGNEAISSGNS